MWYFFDVIIGEIPGKTYFSPGLGGVYSSKYGFKFFDLDYRILKATLSKWPGQLY